MADSWRMAMTGGLHGYGLKGMGVRVPQGVLSQRCSPHCGAATG